jgi:hypothetical protein
MIRNGNNKAKKPFVLRTPDGAVVAGSLTFAYKAPKPGDWIEVINEAKYYNNPAIYNTRVKAVYPNAMYAQDIGSSIKRFLKGLGYNADNTLMSLSVCADDVNAPNFPNVDNLGQHPLSLNNFLGPFMSGGLAGYPHTGITGLGAYASHVTDTGHLFVFNMPHIGISSNGTVGSIIRRGQTGQNTSCGAVLAAVNWVVANGSAPTFPSVAFPENDYQQFLLTDILFPNKTVLSGLTTTDERMVFATEIIRAAGETFLTGPTGIEAISGLTKDVFFCSGIFINVDDSYLPYITISSFKKWTVADGWVDITSAFNSTV